MPAAHRFSREVVYVVFSGKILRQTEKAVQMRFLDKEGEEKVAWMAKSQFSQAMQEDLDSNNSLYQEQEWELAEWLALENNVEVL